MLQMSIANRSKTRNLRGQIVGDSGLAAGVGGGPDETSAEVPDRVMTAVGMSRSRAASRSDVRSEFLIYYCFFRELKKAFNHVNNEV